MNSAHWHLLLSHLPVVGTPLALCFLLAGLLLREARLARVALVFLVLLALGTLPIYFTGRPAVDWIHAQNGFNRMLVERHEETAQFALGVQLLLGLGAALMLGCCRGATLPRWALAALLAGGLLTSGLLGWTASLGGQVRHTETRPAAT
jgi:hypothetical protein